MSGGLLSSFQPAERHGEFVIRPKPPGLGSLVTVVAFGVAAYVLLQDLSPVTLLMAAVVLGALGQMVVSRLRQRLTLTGSGRLLFTGISGRSSTVFDPGEAGRVVRVVIAGRANTTSLFWIDRSGKTRQTLNADDWNPEHLAEVARRLGIQIEVDPVRRVMRDVMNGYPADAGTT